LKEINLKNNKISKEERAEDGQVKVNGERGRRQATCGDKGASLRADVGFCIPGDPPFRQSAAQFQGRSRTRHFICIGNLH
jgi:hypothetical protein